MIKTVEFSYMLAKELCPFGASTLTVLNNNDDNDNYYYNRWCNFLLMIGKFPFKLSVKDPYGEITQVKLEYLTNKKEIYSKELERGYSSDDVETCSEEIEKAIFDIIYWAVPGDHVFGDNMAGYVDATDILFDLESIQTIESDKCTEISRNAKPYGKQFKFSVPVNDTSNLEVDIEIYQALTLAIIRSTIINLEDYSRIDKIYSHLYNIDEKISLDQMIKDMTSKRRNKSTNSRKNKKENEDDGKKENRRNKKEKNSDDKSDDLGFIWE